MENDHAAETESKREGRPLEIYEWAGGIFAGLSFFLTPVIVAVPAGYCAWKLRIERPLTTYAIVAVLAASTVFWSLFLLAGDLMNLLVGVTVTSAVAFATLGILLAVVAVLIGAVVSMLSD